jgi:hypothetical protein
MLLGDGARQSASSGDTATSDRAIGAHLECRFDALARNPGAKATSPRLQDRPHRLRAAGPTPGRALATLRAPR